MLRLALFLCLAAIVKTDLVKTVYCKSHCNDYLRIQEPDIPQCLEEHLQMNHCGAIISCSWADVEAEKQRKPANSSEVTCCYKVVFKEKGDCDVQSAHFQQQQQQRSQSDEVTSRADCSNPQPLFLLIGVLTLLVVLMSCYIAWMSMRNNVKTLDPHPYSPVFAARPIREQRLLESVALA
ncbi:unnamed protein product [Caenorhabditis auriculariae]|uniref:Uncharacterized protein n=1 Tax=Caenorhabditis auriculariae TaxID=2777116 RepID=A0A8S1HR89_9PELO|nr:unnamed protein product [Caenorhabditis auriculariae]